LVNADVLALELGADAYLAMRMAGALRQQLLKQRESFVFETVFSDTVGEKVAFLHEATNSGYNVILCFIGISGANISEERVAMRVSQGGHDVPPDKLTERFPRTIANLKAAVRVLPRIFIFDNENIARPYQQVAVFEHGKPVFLAEPLPAWLAGVL
jgi:predicted ABC-type ATPase